MAQPVTVYRWDDPGAPQLINGKISSFFDVLQKCLVDGYGAQSPLGWTRSYYDPVNFKAAWRNSVAAGGSGGSAYFYSNTNNDVNQTVTRMTTVQSITEAGATTGINRLVAMQLLTKTTCWVLIGTAIGFYFYTFETNGSGRLVQSNLQRPCFYMGDFFSVLPNDAGRFNMASNITDTGDSASVTYQSYLSRLSTVSSSSANYFVVQDADGNNSSFNYGWVCGFTSSQNDGATSPNLLPNVYSPFIITLQGSYGSTVDRLGIPIKNSEIRPVMRGVLPGLYGLVNGVGRDEVLPATFIDGADNYHILPCDNASGNSRAVIKAGAWDDPFN